MDVIPFRAELETQVIDLILGIQRALVEADDRDRIRILRLWV